MTSKTVFINQLKRLHSPQSGASRNSHVVTVYIAWITDMKTHRCLARGLGPLLSAACHQPRVPNWHPIQVPVRCLRIPAHDIDVHRVHFKALAGLCNYSPGLLSVSWHYRKLPESGIDVDVEYLDTQPGITSSPVILALHDCQGSHLDFRKIRVEFGSSCRVIAPNFPDFSLTKSNGCFYHSAVEKATFIRDFLKTIGVNRVDLLIAHSMAVYPATYLWSNDDKTNREPIDINSVALLNTPGLSLIQWAKMETLLIIWFFSKMKKNVNETATDFVRLKKLYEMSGLKFKAETYDEMVYFLLNCQFANTMSLAKRMRKLADLRLPTLYLMSMADEIFDAETFYTNLNFMGAQYHHHDVYEGHNNKLIQRSSGGEWLRVVNLMGGGHSCYQTHSKLVHWYLKNILEIATQKQIELFKPDLNEATN